jgi:polyphenol oxidase
MMFMSDLQPSDGFEWAQAPWGPVLRCRPLLEAAVHFFTVGNLELRDKQQEWAAVASYSGVEVDGLRKMRQVHGNRIALANGSAWVTPEADGVIGNDRSTALVVRVADCAPILIADRRTGAAAAVHAGWRSTVQRIVIAAVSSLREQFGSNPGDLMAAIGPALGECCGEMGEEVVDAFVAAGHGQARVASWFVRTPGARPHFDLIRANRDQLHDAGIPPSAVFAAGLCTKTHSEVFHSYRAMGPEAGRMAGVIRPRG